MEATTTLIGWRPLGGDHWVATSDFQWLWVQARSQMDAMTKAISILLGYATIAYKILGSTGFRFPSFGNFWASMKIWTRGRPSMGWRQFFFPFSARWRHWCRSKSSYAAFVHKPLSMKASWHKLPREERESSIQWGFFDTLTSLTNRSMWFSIFLTATHGH